MGTTFKIKLTQTNGSEWDVDLGQSILEGLSQTTKDTYAEAHAVVVMQNNPKYALRHAEDDEQIISVLKGVYPQVRVTPHIKTESKVKMTKEQLLAKILGVDVSKITPEVMAEAQALVQ